MEAISFNEFLNEKKEYKIQRILDAPKYKAKVKDFLTKAKQEVGEYKEVGVILKKAALGNKLSKDDIHKVTEQLIDTLKMGSIGTVLILPMGSIILVLLLKIGKRYNLNFLPSSWS